jgi:hypothetical protein
VDGDVQRLSLADEHEQPLAKPLNGLTFNHGFVQVDSEALLCCSGFEVLAVF